MSIIHDALKKAAAEGEVLENQHSAFAYHSIRSFRSIGRPFLILSGFSLVLLYFLLPSQYLSPVSLSSSDKKEMPSSQISPPLALPVPLLDHVAPPLQTSALSDNNLGPKSDIQGKEAERLLVEGLGLYHQGKIELARQSFFKAVSLMPRSPVAHNNLGLTLRQQGKLEEAKAHYEKAIRLDSNYAEAENNLGMVYDQAGSIDQAVIYYKKAIHLDPSVAAFHFNYATLLERKGDFAQARKEYQLYLMLESNLQKESIALVKAHLKELEGL